MVSKQRWPEMAVAGPEQNESDIGVSDVDPETISVEEARGRIYGFLGASSRTRTRESGGGCSVAMSSDWPLPPPIRCAAAHAT